MIKSMTGYASESFIINSAKFIVEIKSVNSKILDLNIRFPHFLKAYENDLKLSILETNFNNIYSDGMISNSRIKNFKPDYIILLIDLYQLDDQLNLELSNKKIISQKNK